MTQKLLKILNKETQPIPAIWMMRQAGRYLPEYLKIRQQVKDFLELCYTPELASEVTLQPLKRFDFDAAIFFSDILVIPHALGRNLAFEKNIGPILNPISPSEIDELVQNFNPKEFLKFLTPCFETLKLSKKQLSADKSLIGFCGAPWTVATYMIKGHGSNDHRLSKIFALQHPEKMDSLIALLTQASILYLSQQIESGADVIQIFDSWCSVLDSELFYRYSILPTQKIVQKIHETYPHVPIIGFPRQAGLFYPAYQTETNVTALSLDWTVPYEMAKKLQEKTPIQGNLDPLRLLVGGKALETEIEKIVYAFKDNPFIFNLGHGILPETPIAHVSQMIEWIKKYSLEHKG